MLLSVLPLCVAGYFACPPAGHIDEHFLANPKAPAANQAILRFAKDHLGKKVGDGECTTLVVEAYRRAKLKPPSAPDEPWGELIQEIKPGVKTVDSCLPGDILQMKNVRLEGKGGEFGGYFLSAPQHTAVVSKVGKDMLHLLHQNWGKKDEERPVVAGTLLVGDLREGVVRVYRPR